MVTEGATKDNNKQRMRDECRSNINKSIMQSVCWCAGPLPQILFDPTSVLLLVCGRRLS